MPSSLDPVTLGELASAMRDAAWLDARIVPGGVVHRVRVEALVVRRTEEEVEFIQVWATEQGRQSQKFTVHSEDIWWIKPTEQHDVTLVSPFNPRVQLELGDSDEAHWEAAFRAVAAFHRTPPDEVKLIAKARLDPERYYRYKVMLVVQEISPHLSVDAITRGFGYHSPTPLSSARATAKVEGWNIPKMVRIAREELKTVVQ